MKALLTTILIWLAWPALATQDAWPALHDVTGVAGDDVLNIRATPDANAPIVGTLAPDARNVEVVRPNDPLTWGVVNTAEGMGWVSLRFLQRQPAQYQGAFPILGRCLGTEPFWTLALIGDTATFSTPESEEQGTVLARLGSLNRRDRHGLRLSLNDGSKGGEALDGVIRWEACSDFMSDREYGLSYDMIRGDAVLSGCCTLGR
ncbi:COG3650 family protein [Jannaschia sp. M317]|uniref:COG3650 family protein n=1 Tax=Jannaschia sp. M317 TaxID=2867011 RepID=UPI0021A7FAA9|nr:peptide-binding protein [Jannaschia sp. M317]UWQ18301.1 peptide-binding protein [Jannaschia sp. M317]